MCVCVFSSLSLGSVNKGKAPVFSMLFWMHFEVMPLPLNCDENVHLRILMVGFIVLFLWIIFQIIMLALHVILSYNLDSLWAIYILKFEP